MSSKQYRQLLRQLSLGAILSAFAILIPLMMPIRVIIGPASFTLASHVPVFLAMFLSLRLGVMVALVSSLGFFLAGYPIVIVGRALSHLLFAYVGGVRLAKENGHLTRTKAVWFAVWINLIHALAEFVVVMGLTWQSNLSVNYVLTVFGLVGVGTFAHGMVDFILAFWLWTALKHRGLIKAK